VNTLALKLALTPTLIGAVSLAGRRWGPSVGGWLVGLPLTSAPLVFFLAVERGSTFAAATAIGILTGAVSGAAFCLVYSRLAYHWHWLSTVLAGWLTFAAVTWLLQLTTLPAAPLFLSVVSLLAVVLYLMPRSPATSEGVTAPWWDIPARMVAATGIVLLLTTLASTLGPHLSGLLAPFPLFATILGVFTHAVRGPAAAAQVMRGVVLGMFAFATFFLVVATLIERTGIGVTFALAILVALGVQATTLWLLNRGT
jgi:uncharacterized membrane protein (GlpM family)